MPKRKFSIHVWSVLIAGVVQLSILPIERVRAQTDPATTPSSQEKLFDPFDPFDIGDLDDSLSSKDDQSKSADELLREASLLLMSERPLDARTKLLKALQKDPNLHRTHYLLAGYYLVHVGHFRLAMKYIKRAEELFEKKYGLPPYSNLLQQEEHSNILYYESQIRLSLDNYQGSLETLDRYTQLGYSSEWYPGARAWVLMKLGKIQEAIKVARAGILLGAEPGRTLNMLGILLSMNGQPQEALEVFRKAIASEFSMGTDGQPATPLNNAGEVYKELFEDDKAESSFLRATSLPDGCEHVLPSLNLTLLYIDQMKFAAAASTLDGFQRCIAQFPLKNNEEHMALVNLARGRIDLHTGHVDRAIRRFRTAMDGTQWFGKIGTNQNDLVAAATISLSQALTRKNNIMRTHLPMTWREWIEQKRIITAQAIEAWWLMRRARQILTGELNDLEDLTIRNTDSLIEYPTLGEALQGLSHSALSSRLAKEERVDTRATAKLFYQAYLAENSLGFFYSRQANEILETVIERARPRYDELLRTHASLLRMASLSPTSSRYRELAYRVFYTAPAELRNYGLRLPIRIETGALSRRLRSYIADGPFVESGGEGRDVCNIAAQENTSTGKATLRFSCPGNVSKNRTVEDSDQREVVNKLGEALFSEEISNGGNI